MTSPLIRLLTGSAVAASLLAATALPAAAAAASAAPAGSAAVARGTVPAAAPRTVTLTAFEARLLLRINKARAAAGLRRLVATAGATDVARRWSVTLAASRGLSHNPALVPAMSKAGSGSWQLLAENVGTGPADNADVLFDAYMASPHHRANILEARARFVGIGTVQVTHDAGPAQAWNTMDFTDSYDDRYGATRTPALGGTLALATARSRIRT